MSTAITAIDSIVVAVFGLDMISTFNTAYFDAKTETLITDRRVIAWRYVSTWFPVDLISTLPFDQVTSS
jgi:potassium channel